MPTIGVICLNNIVTGKPVIGKTVALWKIGVRGNAAAVGILFSLGIKYKTASQKYTLLQQF
jgi:hypothetical protein